MSESLTDQELRRYRRHILLPEIGEEGQLKLKNARVIVIGTGGIGSPVLQYLTATGVGNIGIVDDDVVVEENLQRQILYGGSDLGKLKTIVAKEKLTELNSRVHFNIKNIRVNTKNVLDIISDYDIVIDATDNYDTKYLLNDACIVSRKIFIFGAIYKFEGQIAVFNYQNGPSLRCAFPSFPKTNIISNEILGVIGVVPALVGVYQVNEAIKIITEIGEPLSGKVMIFNALENRFSYFAVKKDIKNFKIDYLS